MIMIGDGVILVEVKGSEISVNSTGNLTHIEMIGALTMAIHNLEFTAMSAKEK
jgi:hypothetical protein